MNEEITPLVKKLADTLFDLGMITLNEHQLAIMDASSTDIYIQELEYKIEALEDKIDTLEASK